MQTFNKCLSKYIGPLGRWQCLTFIIINLTVFGNFSTFPQLASLTPNHHCAVPALEKAGLSPIEIRVLAIPAKSSRSVNNRNNGTLDFDNCFQYVVSSSDGNRSIDSDSLNHTISRHKTTPCENGWSYDKSAASFRNSFTQHFDLVCHRKYFLPISSTLYFIGSIIGRIVGGFLADRLGRKPVLIGSCLSTCLLGTIIALSPDILTFSIIRFLLGITANAATLCNIVMWSEITNDKHRNTLGFLYGIQDSFLVPVSSVLYAYLTQDWRYFHIAMTVPYGLAIFHPLLISESPRWLLSSRKMKQAFKVIRKAMRLNGRSSKYSKEELKTMEKELKLYYESETCPDCHLDTDTSWRDNKIIVLLTRPYLRRRMLPFLFIWSVIMGSIMGLQYYSVRMKHGNPYLVAFVGYTFTIPGLVMKQFLYHFFDRKRPLIAVFAVAGIVCVAGAGLRGMNINGPWNAALATTALGCALVAQNMCYALTAEAFPTMYRSYAMGLVSGVGRAGAALSTFVERLDVYVWSGLPLTIFGALSFLAAVVVHFVPGGGLDQNEMDITKSLQQLQASSSQTGGLDEVKVLVCNADGESPTVSQVETEDHDCDTTSDSHEEDNNESKNSASQALKQLTKGKTVT